MSTEREDLVSLFNSARQPAQRTEQILHQLAQPLTVLQGAIELALAADNIEDYRRACRTALQQLERISEHFASARRKLQSRAPQLNRGESRGQGLAR